MVLGLIGYSFMCANFTRLFFEYLLPLRAKRFAEGGEQLQAMLGSNNLSLDQLQSRLRICRVMVFSD